MNYSEIEFSRDNAVVIYTTFINVIDGFCYPEDPAEPVSAMLRVDDGNSYEVIVEGDMLSIEDGKLSIIGGGFEL